MKTQKIKNYLILDLTKNEKNLLEDIFTYMIDYINDECFSDKDRDSFDNIYSKLKHIEFTEYV